MSKTLMEHPEHGLREIPLNEWARYRKSGWVFCNDKAKTLAQAEQETAPEVEEPAKAPSKRTTKPKED